MDNEQEMQFADPAWQPKVTREFETVAPTSQSTGSSGSNADAETVQNQAGPAEYDDYARGYRAQNTQTAGRERTFQNQSSSNQQGQVPPFQNQQQPFFQSQQPWYQRLPIWAWWLIGILVLGSIVQPATSQGGPSGSLFALVVVGGLIFVGWLLYTRRVRISPAGETQAAETHTFSVGAQPTIVLKNKAGAINLRAGQEGQVTITTTRRGYLFSPRFDQETPISYSQDSTTNTVTVRSGNWRPFGKNAVNFEVTVPPQANLQLTTNFGNIAAQNVAGQMTLRTDVGSIRATQVTLLGKSRLKSDAGSITLVGSLDPSGNYELSTDLGSITATLPTNASFSLEAQTDLGTITTNLPLVQQQRNKASGTVGTGPYPRLKAQTDLGSVNIYQR